MSLQRTIGLHALSMFVCYFPFSLSLPLKGLLAGASAHNMSLSDLLQIPHGVRDLHVQAYCLTPLLRILHSSFLPSFTLHLLLPSVLFVLPHLILLPPSLPPSGCSNSSVPHGAQQSSGCHGRAGASWYVEEEWHLTPPSSDHVPLQRHSRDDVRQRHCNVAG